MRETSPAPAQWIADRILVLEWYDGPRVGFVRFSVPAMWAYFRLETEAVVADDLNDRVFALVMLPGEEFSRVEDLFGTKHLEGRIVSVPALPPDDTREAAEAHLLQRFAGADADVLVRTPDFDKFVAAWTHGPERQQ